MIPTQNRGMYASRAYYNMVQTFYYPTHLWHFFCYCCPPLYCTLTSSSSSRLSCHSPILLSTSVLESHNWPSCSPFIYQHSTCCTYLSRIILISTIILSAVLPLLSGSGQFSSDLNPDPNPHSKCGSKSRSTKKEIILLY